MPFIGNAIAIGASSPSIPWATYFEMQSIQPSTLSQITIILNADAGSNIKFNWGYGDDIDINTGYDQTLTSIFPTNNTTYNISLSGDLQYLRKIEIASNNTLKINTDDFQYTGLRYLSLYNILSGQVTGSLNLLPRSLRYLRLDKVGSLITGKILGLPSELVSLELTECPLISGNIQDMNSYMIYFLINGSPLVTGSIDNIPSDDINALSIVNCGTTLTGSTDNLPKNRLNYLALVNYGNSLEGNISNFIVNDSWFNSMVYLAIEASSYANKFTGSLDTFYTNNRKVQTIKLVNLSNAITGDLKNVSYDAGATIATGPPLIVLKEIGKLTYTGTTGLFKVTGYDISAQLTRTEIDNLLEDMAANLGAPSLNTYYIYLNGSNDGPSSTSITHANTLDNNGTWWDVRLNPYYKPACIENDSPSKLKLCFDDELNESIVPDTADFAITGKTITLVEISGRFVYLTVSVPFVVGDVVTVDYTQGTNILTRINDGQVSSWSAMAVENNCSTKITGTITISSTGAKTTKFKNQIAGDLVYIDWGDGSAIELAPMNNRLNTLTHNYTATGTFNVSMTASHSVDTIESCPFRFDFSGFAGARNLVKLHANSFFGDLNNIPKSVTYFHAQTSPITGSLNNVPPDLTYFYLAFPGTGISGDANSLPASLTTLFLYLNAGHGVNITAGTPKAWANTTITLITFASADVDTWLIAYAAVAGAGTKTITMQKTRTSASDAAVAILNGLGKTVKTSG